MRSAGNVREDLPEVVEAHAARTTATEDQVRGAEQRPVTGILPEVIRAAGDLTTELPDALVALGIDGAEPRVEVHRDAVISRRCEAAAGPGRPVARTRLDARQIGLEANPFKWFVVVGSGEGARELYGRRVQRGVAVGPHRLIGDPVKARVGVGTAVRWTVNASLPGKQKLSSESVGSEFAPASSVLPAGHAVGTPLLSTPNGVAGMGVEPSHCWKWPISFEKATLYVWAAHGTLVCSDEVLYIG